MAWNLERSGEFFEKEILKYPVGTEAVKNVVIDSTTVAATAGGRFIVESGTVLSKIAASTKVKPAPASGLAQADVVGILAITVEFAGDDGDETDEPGAAFFHGCVFDTTKLVNYTNNAAAIKAALPTCIFE